MPKKSFIAGALILTLASFITRLLGFCYRIYMSNLIGAEGMGLFQLIFPIYMLMWTICASGLSTSVMKLVAAESGKHQLGNTRRILKIATTLSVATGICLSVLIYIFAPQVATYVIKEPRTTLALRYMALCIPFMAASCSLKGYFYGLQEMAKPATAQVIEQVARMLVVYFFASLFVPKGLNYACAMGVLGMGVGELTSFLFVFCMYYIAKYKNKKPYRPTLSHTTIFTMLMGMAIPLTASRFLTSSLQTIQNILIPTQLMAHGLSNHQAMSLYGQFSGMAMPLIFFPSMLTMSLATALVPAVSEARASRNTRLIHRTVSKSIQFTMLIGIGTTTLFLSLSHELGVAIYNQPDVGKMLYAMAWACPFFYLQSTLVGVLNGLGQQMVTLRNNIIGSILCIAIIYFYIPKLGIQGFVIALLVCSFTISFLNLLKTLKFTSITFDLNNWLIKPIIAAAAGGLTIRYILTNFLLINFSIRLATLWGVLVLAGFYLVFLFLLQCITKDDLKMVRNNF